MLAITPSAVVHPHGSLLTLDMDSSLSAKAPEDKADGVVTGKTFSLSTADQLEIQWVVNEVKWSTWSSWLLICSPGISSTIA